jgi:hypothetical protein
MLPWTTDILRGVTLQTFSINVGEYIKLSVCVTDGWCPYTLTVYLLVILKRESIVVEVETVETIRYVFPIYQIFRVQYYQTGHGVHGGTGKVVVIAHTDYVGVGELIVK